MLEKRHTVPFLCMMPDNWVLSERLAKMVYSASKWLSLELRLTANEKTLKPFTLLKWMYVLHGHERSLKLQKFVKCFQTRLDWFGNTAT